MSIRGKTAIVGIGETPTDRLGSKPGEPRKSTAEYLAWAARLAMEDAGLTKKDFDGQGLAAIYTTNHSQPFWPEEVAAILGITPGVSIAGGNGGALARGQLVVRDVRGRVVSQFPVTLVMTTDPAGFVGGVRQLAERFEKTRPAK